MTTWHVILLAAILVYALKVAGYLIPESFIEKPTPSRVANLLTVALLAGLIVVQTLGAGQSLSVDARVPAVMVAAVLFALRVPFIVVVFAAALIAAVIRMLT